MGYSLEAAIADLVDNSIAAHASKVDIFFFPIDGAYIAILDDGVGMSPADITSAMQYGSRNPREVRAMTDLGRFGLGLKTASLSQCRTLTVVSKREGHNQGRRWDVDHVIRAGDWSLLLLDEDDMMMLPEIDRLNQLTNGTLVVWQNLDRLMAGETHLEQSLGRQMDAVRDHLSLVFHRYLSGEAGIQKLVIRINNAAIQSADPFLVTKSSRPMDDEILLIRDQQVVIRPYILPHVSRMTASEISLLGGKEGLRRQQGFYIYRNKRLLVWGTWFRMMRQAEMAKLARIRIDIPNTLDDLWTLDIKKSVAIPPAEVRENLASVIERIAEHSKRTWTFRGRKETDDSIVHVWHRFVTAQGGVFYEINRDHPLVEPLIRSPDSRQYTETLLRQIERGIPLNQLYIDFQDDKQFENEADIPEKAIEEMLNQVLTPFAKVADREEMLNRLEKSEPFVDFPSLIKKYRHREC